MTMRLKSSPCIHCGSINDAASEATGKDTEPKPGDISLCLLCGHIAVYADDMSIRELTADEQIKVAGNPVILAVQRARRALEPKP